MKSLLKYILTLASLGLLFGYAQTTFAQVSMCSDTGCTAFALECRTGGGDVVCYYPHYSDSPTDAETHVCNVAQMIMENKCSDSNANPQPCIIAEMRVIERCKYIPTTMCVEDPNTIPDILYTHPDVCLGDCAEVLEKLSNPNGPQPICNTNF